MAAAQPFNRRHARTRDLGDGHEARVHGSTVHQHRAGPTLAFAAPFLGSRQAAVLAQDVEQTFQRMHLDAVSPAVEREAHVTKMEPRRPLSAQSSLLIWLSAVCADSAVKQQPS